MGAPSRKAAPTLAFIAVLSDKPKVNARIDVNKGEVELTIDTKKRVLALSAQTGISKHLDETGRDIKSHAMLTT